MPRFVIARDIPQIVAGDKTFCIYHAANEALIHEHAKRSGFPATKITSVRKMIDPATADAT
jgi:hypothetical protein